MDTLAPHAMIRWPLIGRLIAKGLRGQPGNAFKF